MLDRWTRIGRRFASSACCVFSVTSKWPLIRQPLGKCPTCDRKTDLMQTGCLCGDKVGKACFTQSLYILFCKSA